MRVQHAMGAAGAALAAGAPLHALRQGLRSFQATYYLAPGRLNVTEINGVTIVVDYAHNAAGMRLLGDFVDKLADNPSDDLLRHRRIGVISTAGDRRDEDLRELGEVASRPFDILIVREDAKLRGRAPGETAGFIVDGANGGGRVKSVETVLDEIDATRRALDLASPGDLVVLCVDSHAAVWSEIQARSKMAQAGARAITGDPDL